MLQNSPYIGHNVSPDAHADFGNTVITCELVGCGDTPRDSLSPSHSARSDNCLAKFMSTVAYARAGSIG